MKIKDIFEEKEHVISFEIFPPNKNFSEERLKEVTSELIKHKPDFISVTYGAGGTTKSGTIEMSSHIKNNLKSEVLAHLTCVGSKKTEIASFLEEAKNHNIKNIMALRGDIPQGEDESIYEKGDYRYASDLIRNIKETHDDFSIGAAFYPETHYESNDLADIVHLKKKVDEGVDFLISQVCFDNRMFVDFREKAEKLKEVDLSEIYALKAYYYYVLIALNSKVNGPKYYSNVFRNCEKALEINAKNPRALAIQYVFKMQMGNFLHAKTDNQQQEQERIMTLFNEENKNTILPRWGKELLSYINRNS